jgi:hypothetical protein
MANADHERDGAVVHNVQHVVRKCVGFRLVECGVGQFGLQSGKL